MSVSVKIRKELRLLIRELGLLNHNCLNSGMTITQAHILNYLNQNGITSFSELQIQLEIDKASLSKILNGLEKQHFIAFKNDESDMRVTNIMILPSGINAINTAEYESSQFLTSILDQRPENLASSFPDSLKIMRISLLRNTLASNKQRLIIQPLSPNYKESATELLLSVFSTEQTPPSELVPLNDNFKALWWGARVGEDIFGVVASWIENNEWHWGRFAVQKDLRGLGIGKKLAIYSLEHTFSQGVERIFIEANETTVNMIRNLGGEVIGERKDFYGEPGTPMVLEKTVFFSTKPS